MNLARSYETYTKEEMTQLFTMSNRTSLGAMDLFPEQYDILWNYTIEKVPLYINDEDNLVKTIAKWRLMIGK